MSSEAELESLSSSQHSERLVVPQCLQWTVEEVADWIEGLGFQQYRECFISNLVSGHRLIWVNSSNLPQIGVSDWKHIQFISAKVRELLHIEEPYWNKSITLPHRCELGLFLERKSFTGRRADRLIFEPKATN